MEKWNVIDFRTHLLKLQHDQIKLSEWLLTVVVTVIVIILVIVFVWPFDILWDRILSILNVLHPIIKVPIRSYILQILPTPFVTWYSSHSNIVSKRSWNFRIRTDLSYSCRWPFIICQKFLHIQNAAGSADPHLLFSLKTNVIIKTKNQKEWSVHDLTKMMTIISFTIKT